MSEKREQIKALVVTVLFCVVYVATLFLIPWAAKHDWDELSEQREAIRIMARREWTRAVEAWSERGEAGQHPMDFVPVELRENATAREAIANAKFDAGTFDAMKKEATR